MLKVGSWFALPGSTIRLRVAPGRNVLTYKLSLRSTNKEPEIVRSGPGKSVLVFIVEAKSVYHIVLEASPKDPGQKAVMETWFRFERPDGSVEVDQRRSLEFDGGEPWAWTVASLKILESTLEYLIDDAPTPGTGAYREPRPTFGEGVSPAPSRRAKTPARKRVVNTGFASSADPTREVPRSSPLPKGGPYLFWLEIGEPLDTSIEVVPRSLPTSQLPRGARLTVALFAPEGQVEIESGADIGVIRLQDDGSAIVERQPGALRNPRIPRYTAMLRLYFPVKIPDEPGTYRLRCNIYHEQLLVQSRLIRVPIGPGVRKVITSTVEYSLSSRLDGGHLARIAPHALSVMLNKGANGTHDIHVMGPGGMKGSVSLTAGAIKTQNGAARRALRLASWDGEEEVGPNDVYRYRGPGNLGLLKRDLGRFAIWGYRFYRYLISALEQNQVNTESFEKAMQEPRLVQVVMKESPPLVLPAAMIYDNPLDDAYSPENMTLCPAFLSALQQAAPLEEIACFQGRCPGPKGLTVVCPGGFWGYRHELGMPLSIPSGMDVPIQIPILGEAKVVGGMSTDPALEERPAHLEILKSLCPTLPPRLADSRDGTISVLKTTEPHLVYFYCHGGLDLGVPYIQVGPKNELGITPTNLSTYKIRWPLTHPLVFINGCHTTALDPETAMSLMTEFVQESKASGVIGTEISVFEPLARGFAEDFLPRFLAREPVGRAVRKTRLALLKKMNPLGLVYVPFVRSDLGLAIDTTRGIDLTEVETQPAGLGMGGGELVD